MQKTIADLQKQVGDSSRVEIPTTPEQMAVTQAVQITVSKMTLAPADDEYSDTSPKSLSDWHEDEQDQKKGWESPLVNRGGDLDSLEDTDESDEDNVNDVKIVGVIASPPIAKKRIEYSSSEEEDSSEEEEEEEEEDNSLQLKPPAIKSPTRFRKGKDNKSNMLDTSHRETRSSRRKPNSISNSRGPGVGQDH